MSFENLPPHAYVSLPAAEQARAQYQYQQHPMPYFPQPPFIPDRELQRKVWMWFVIFCVLLSLLYLTLIVIGIASLALDPRDLEMDFAEAKINGVVLIISGMFFIPFAIAPFLPKKSWVWVYGLILLILGSIGSCCFWPFTIPLIIQWVKPDIKHMFGHR
jgi:hypothetical protein